MRAALLSCFPAFLLSCFPAFLLSCFPCRPAFPAVLLSLPSCFPCRTITAGDTHPDAGPMHVQTIPDFT